MGLGPARRKGHHYPIHVYCRVPDDKRPGMNEKDDGRRCENDKEHKRGRGDAAEGMLPIPFHRVSLETSGELSWH